MVVSGLREALFRYAISAPGAWEDRPWGHPVVKVRSKIFAFIDEVRPDGAEFRLTVKLPTSAPVALELPFAEPAGYGLGKAGWVTLRVHYAACPPTQQLLHWVWESYGAVAPKTLARAFAPPV